MMSATIERQYPRYETEHTYPLREDASVFEKVQQMNADAELQEDYRKWKDGINYKTNRKIKIGGRLHRKLEDKFQVSGVYITSKHVHSFRLDKLNRIDADEYLQETKNMCDEVDAKNCRIREYNKLVGSIIEQINNLERWGDFIEFEGKRYGIPRRVLNGIHVENDCLGDMVFTHKDTKYISNDRPWCFYEDTKITYSVYRCSTCDYEHHEEVCRTGGGRDNSKTGFWWK